MGNSKILIIGATGHIGKHIVKASARLGHPTFILVRPSASAPSPAKKELYESFASLGVTSLHGTLEDHESLLAALKQVDVVISAVSGGQTLDGQLKIIEAVKEVGHIKRFVPSEFGIDLERFRPYLPVLEPYISEKRKIREVLREKGIPYTLINSNAFAGWLLDPLLQVDLILEGKKEPPRDKVTILGSGDIEISATTEDDIATFTIKAVDDPRTLNKLLVIRPKENILTVNSIVALWEKKLGHSLEKTYVREAEVVKEIEESSPPKTFLLAIIWTVSKGASVFDFGPGDVAAVELYPEVKYETVDEYLSKFI